ncbi:MAG TPA: LysE family translocator [Streptosporangiaceae bacterium]|jgi:threonine/homoserine/homoserine lactone efflux protein
MIGALLGFAIASTLLILAPGPDSLLVMRNTLRRGRRAGWVTGAGTVSGLLIWAVAAALGLSALLRASQLGYDVLRLAGAAYLVWLGVSSLRSARRAAAAPGPGSAPDSALGGFRSRHAYLSGLLSNLLNPKIGVFFIAFLPGFIPAGVPAAAFSLALGLWFLVETGAWLAVLAWMTASGAGWLQRGTARQWLERLTGVALIGIGLALAADAR